MRKTLRSLAVAAATSAVLSVIPLALASTAGASTLPALGTHSSANWAGYVATAQSNQLATDQFGGVQATFVVPKITCKDSTMGNKLPNPAGWYSGAAFWVGLGGVSSAQLEQDGVMAICANKTSNPAYSAFYEMFPLQPSGVLTGLYTSTGKHVVVHAGDKVTVGTWDYSTESESTSHTYAPGRVYKFLITDQTQHAHSRIPLQIFNPGTLGNDKTVEVVSEAINGGPWSGHHTGLAHFQPVTYTGVSFGYNGGGYGYGFGAIDGATAAVWTLTHGKSVLISTGRLSTSVPTTPTSFANTWHKH
jgi:hypothetical protein